MRSRCQPTRNHGGARRPRPASYELGPYKSRHTRQLPGAYERLLSLPPGVLILAALGISWAPVLVVLYALAAVLVG